MGKTRGQKVDTNEKKTLKGFNNPFTTITRIDS
jgi:hypothetical protein